MATTTTKPAQRQQTAENIVAPLPPADNLPAARPRTAVNAIVPATWQEVTAIAAAICRANMAPKSYCQTDGYGKLIYVNNKPVPEPEKVAIAIMHGMEVGMTPMASLQSLAVINGMPSIYGDGLVGVVRASGLLEDLQEGLQVDEQGKPMIAWCKVKRRGEASWKERELTYAECMRAGWTGKDGPWKLTPGRMMTVRVRGWLLRDMFADVLRGLHSAEEVEDMVDVTPQGAATVVPPEPKRGAPAEAADTQDKPSPPTPPTVQSGDDGQAGNTPAAGGGSADASGQPENKPVDKSTITDVVDENETVPITFQKFTRIGDFFKFADDWIVDKNRTEAELIAFSVFYREYMLERMDPAFKSPAVRAGMLDTKRLLDEAITAAEKRGRTREPGEEG